MDKSIDLKDYNCWQKQYNKQLFILLLEWENIKQKTVIFAHESALKG